MIFSREKHIIEVKGTDTSVFVFQKKIRRYKKKGLVIKFSAKNYIAIPIKIQKLRPESLIKRSYKTKHFLSWAIKLLVPDFLIGHPNLWDNLQSLRKNPQFKPLRMALAAWLIFTMIAGSTGMYALLTAPKAKAADSWYNTDWLYRKKITLNNTDANLGVTAETLTDFPILVKLDSGVEIDYTKTQDSGQDIRFTDSDGTTLLKYEIEKWDETGSSYVWVKVPSIDTTGEDYVYMYYGNTGADDGQDKNNVWDSSYIMVQHLEETDIDGGAEDIADSTSNGNNGATFGMDANDQVSGKINGNFDFDGTNDRVDIGALSGSIPDVNTISFFAKRNTIASSYKTLCGIQSSYGGWVVYENGNITLISTAGNALGGWDGTWTDKNDYHHIVLVTSVIGASGTVELFFDGVSKEIKTLSTFSTDSFTIGNFITAHTQPFSGLIDEVRVSNSVLSAGRIAAEYKSGTDAFNSFDIEEVANVAPNTPTNSLPANGAVNQILTPTLTSSVFSDNDAGDTHAASQWQISTTSGNYGTTVFDSGEDAVNLTSIAVSPALTADTTYYWHVRHKDNNGAWSEYSIETSFTTSQTPSTPTNSSPTNGAMDQILTLVLASSAFSDADTGSSHSASQWLVRSLSDANYSSPVYDSGNDDSNLVSIDIPSDELEKNTTYFWKVRYKDDQNVWSSYSSETAFSTGLVPITVVSVGATEYTSGETAKMTVQVTDADGSPINDATVTVSVYAPNNDKLVDAQAMTYLTASNGIYYRNYTTPETAGVYIYEVTATSGADSSYSSHTFHVSSALNTISTINTTVQSESTAQTSERSAQATERTNQATERTAQATERTEQEASRAIVEDIQTDVHTANTNLDILVGALIVTQSAVNDESATTTSFDTDLTNSTDDFYKNSVLTFTSGNLNGQIRRISGYNGTTKVITLDPALTSAPADNDTFTIVKQNVRVEEQAEAIQSDVTDIKTDVTYIRGKVDDIYTLLGTVDTNLSSTQSAVNSIRTSQQKPYKAKLSDAGQIQTGNTYRAKLILLNYEDEPVDAATTPTITIYDSARATEADAQNMTKLSTGVYEYTHSISSTDATGLWEAIVTTAVGSSSSQTLNDYFDVTGSPAQVLINSISDSTIPTITADATITNEGSGDYEYHYEWCVVADQANQCGGNDDAYYASASKLIQTGQDFDTTLSATVTTAGDYWFKLIVYYGTEASGASSQFTATASTSTPSGGGGSYVPSQTVTIDALGTQIGAMKSLIENQSSQLEKVLALIGNLNPQSSGFKSLLEISQEGAGDLKSIQNKINDLKAVSEITKTIVKDGVGEPVIQTWYTEGSIILNVLVTNPTDANRIVVIKQYLPKEIKSQDIIDMDPALTLQYDANLDSYYISANVSVKPGESKKLFIRANDVFKIADTDLQSLRSQTETLIKPLENTSYFAQGTVLKSEIDADIDSIAEFNKMNFSNIEDRISKFREYQRTLESVKENIDALKSLVVQTSGSGGIVGKIGGIQTVATWGIILSMILGFCLISFAIFSVRRYRITQPNRQGESSVIVLDAELIDALKNIKKINEHLATDIPVPKKNSEAQNSV